MGWGFYSLCKIIVFSSKFFITSFRIKQSFLWFVSIFCSAISVTGGKNSGKIQPKTILIGYSSNQYIIFFSYDFLGGGGFQDSENRHFFVSLFEDIGQNLCK